MSRSAKALYDCFEGITHTNGGVPPSAVADLYGRADWTQEMLADENKTYSIFWALYRDMFSAGIKWQKMDEHFMEGTLNLLIDSFYKTNRSAYYRMFKEFNFTISTIMLEEPSDESSEEMLAETAIKCEELRTKTRDSFIDVLNFVNSSPSCFVGDTLINLHKLVGQWKDEKKTKRWDYDYFEMKENHTPINGYIASLEETNQLCILWKEYLKNGIEFRCNITRMKMSPLMGKPLF
jgi:hypothetical protein